ncbi:MAG: tRNA pseudouridine(55) synthase TruB [Oscillospiraceae bacterium]|jgi:tRNA pseudouridine55 synthase|nr:tRNA pseudouridine(55) synthase TruB [Oscillospiraceae bacterium]
MVGFLCLDKREGVTSFRAVAEVRKITGEKKAGHTGTLDPMATGVLPVALGCAARFISLLPSDQKAYIARFRLGTVTDTLDITGTVLETQSVDAGEGDVQALLPGFRGKIVQVPPMYSALMHNGKRLYDLARQGIEVERKEREVTIKKLELTGAFENDEYEIAVDCSAGTYIRTLVADIGAALGCGAVLTALRRTQSNGFLIKKAFTVEEVREKAEKNALQKLIIPVDKALSAYPALWVTAPQSVRFQNGGELDVTRVQGIKKDGFYRVYSPDGAFLGLGEWDTGKGEFLAPKKIFAV